MNKLIEKSYVFSIVLTSLLIGFYGFMFLVGGIIGLGGGFGKLGHVIFTTITTLLFILTLLSYIFALIHSIKQSSLIYATVYGFVLISITLAFIMLGVMPL